MYLSLDLFACREHLGSFEATRLVRIPLQTLLPLLPFLICGFTCFNAAAESPMHLSSDAPVVHLKMRFWVVLSLKPWTTLQTGRFVPSTSALYCTKLELDDCIPRNL
eukprot:1859503-Rhodomonas_salina.1